MSDDPEPPPLTPKQDPEALVLRARPRPVVRFRRSVVIGGLALASVSVVAFAWLALEPPSLHLAGSGDEGGEPAGNAAAESLAGAPSSYAEVPKLGPPLPGDLGKPILDQQRGLEPQVVERGEPGDANGAAAERRAQLKAARDSALIVQLAARNSSGDPGKATDALPAAPPTIASAAGEVPAGAVADPNGQQHKLEFARGEAGDVNPDRQVPSPSPWTLRAGTIIPASLVTGLDSDLPGMVVAQVSADVLDSATGKAVLVPRGSRLVGRYDSLVAFGQKRALLVWDRILFPDGSSVRLDRMPATDLSGYAGLEDRLDRHGWELVKGVALSTLLGVGTELSFGDGEGDLVRALREAAQQGTANAGAQIVSRNLDVQPTIRVRPGWPVLVLVSKDLVLRRWTGYR